MDDQYEISIPQVLLHYHPNELARWRQGDPSLVPATILNWKGPGRENGYGFGEFISAGYLRAQGHEVITSEFDLISKKSKYELGNARIEVALGSDRFHRLRQALDRVRESGVKVEQPDHAVLAGERLYFVESKQDRDQIRPPQEVFAIIAESVIQATFMVHKILAFGANIALEPLVAKHRLPALREFLTERG